MSTITAKNAGAGQGANLVHCSEVGLWEGNQIDAKSVLDTLLQIVPLAPRTVICLESTARGVGNEFHARWKQAERSLAAGLDDFYPFFIAWFEEPENRIEGVTWDALEGLDEREERLRDRYGVDAEQLAWRRWAIRSQLGGDSDRFDQEYPESADVAFLSGRPFFDNEVVQERIDELEIEKPEPLVWGDIVEENGVVRSGSGPWPADGVGSAQRRGGLHHRVRPVGGQRRRSTGRSRVGAVSCARWRRGMGISTAATWATSCSARPLV
jgi:hypothetical protein